MASVKVQGHRVELQNLFQMTMVMTSLHFPGSYDWIVLFR